MKHALLFLLSLTLMLSCNRCKDKECTDSHNPDCPNYVAPVDPCSLQHEVTADFTIEMDVWDSGQPIGPIWFLSDYCIAMVNDVRIKVNIDSAYSFKWILGVDTIYSEEYIFEIANQYAGQNLPVTLIVSGPPNLACFPNDNGMDTLTRYIHVNDVCHADMYGKYRGSWSNSPLDSFDIKIVPTSCTQPFADPYYIVNFDQSGDSCSIDWKSFGNFDGSYATSNSACSSARGSIHLLPDMTHLQMEYRLFDETHPFEPELWPMHHFSGRRIH